MQHSDLGLDVIVQFCGQPELGEDSSCYSFCTNAGLLGVFDGCGGLGAQTRWQYSGRSEAYMAAHLASGAAYDWFCQTFPRQSPPKHGQDLQDGYLNLVLQAFRIRGEGGLKGSLYRPLPTTAALAVVTGQGKLRQVTAMWAGDSRVYLLTPALGLCQLTRDHCTQPDPMENLYDDGILTNVLSADGNYHLAFNQLPVTGPAVVLAATDGCFGYVSTPMEFEGLLLSTLDQADSAAGWETSLAQATGAVSGDDHTMVLAAFGFGSFTALREAFHSRYAQLYQQYLEPLSRLAPDDRAARRAMWQEYAGNYLQFLGGQPCHN